MNLGDEMKVLEREVARLEPISIHGVMTVPIPVSMRDLFAEYFGKGAQRVAELERIVEDELPAQTRINLEHQRDELREALADSQERLAAWRDVAADLASVCARHGVDTNGALARFTRIADDLDHWVAWAKRARAVAK